MCHSQTIEFSTFIKFRTFENSNLLQFFTSKENSQIRYNLFQFYAFIFDKFQNFRLNHSQKFNSRFYFPVSIEFCPDFFVSTCLNSKIFALITDQNFNFTINFFSIKFGKKSLFIQLSNQLSKK